MSYSIPSEDRLAEAVFIVLYRNQQVHSQRELVNLVVAELNRDGSEYRVSGERIRRLIINRNMGQITIDYNDSEGELPQVCPVCRNKIISVMNSTLDGNMIEVTRKCTACPFTVGMTKRVPGRYTFTKKKR